MLKLMKIIKMIKFKMIIIVFNKIMKINRMMLKDKI